MHSCYICHQVTKEPFEIQGYTICGLAPCAKTLAQWLDRKTTCVSKHQGRNWRIVPHSDHRFIQVFCLDCGHHLTWKEVKSNRQLYDFAHINNRLFYQHAKQGNYALRTCRNFQSTFEWPPHFLSLQKSYVPDDGTILLDHLPKWQYDLSTATVYITSSNDQPLHYFSSRDLTAGLRNALGNLLVPDSFAEEMISEVSRTDLVLNLYPPITVQSTYVFPKRALKYIASIYVHRKANRDTNPMLPMVEHLKALPSSSIH